MSERRWVIYGGMIGTSSDLAGELEKAALGRRHEFDYLENGLPERATDEEIHAVAAILEMKGLLIDKG